MATTTDRPTGYDIWQTRRGDYAVRYRGIILHDHERGGERRYATRAEAEGALAAIHARAAAAERRADELAAHHRMMAAEAPDLIRRQLAWQEWRNGLYEARQHAARAASHIAAKPVSDRGMANPRYGEAQRAKQDRAIEEAEELRRAYARAVATDAAIKAAYAHGEPAAYEAALAEGEALMREIGAIPAAPAPPPAPDGEAKRDVNLIVRVTPVEREALHDAAGAAGATLSDYVRARLGLPGR